LKLASVISFIIGLRIQRNRGALQLKPQGKRPRGRPRKNVEKVVEHFLKTIGVEDWKKVIQESRWIQVANGSKGSSEKNDVK